MRRFGVEFEISACPQTQQRDWGGFECRSDGSVNGCGLEFVSPPLKGDDGYKTVEAFLTRAESNRWRANVTCGFHVHVDIADVEKSQVRSIVYGYLLTRVFWHGVVSPGRKINQYCRDLEVTADNIHLYSMPGFLRAVDTRYRWINAHAMHRHNTIENRLHEGTVDRRAALPWIKANVNFVDVCSKLSMAEIKSRFDRPQGPQFRQLEYVFQDDEVSRYYRKKLCL